MSDGSSDDFVFDVNAPRFRISEETMLADLRRCAKRVNNRYFTKKEYNKFRRKGAADSSTIINRFGSWREALSRIGIKGGRKWKYSPEELIENLEKIWQELGHHPAEHLIGKFGARISAAPYRHHWGSVRAACEAFADYKGGKLSREELLVGKPRKTRRRAISPRTRRQVFKRDGFRCQLCGATKDKATLVVDHIIPVAKGGTDDIKNLQTLCEPCNQGKSDSIE